MADKVEVRTEAELIGYIKAGAAIPPGIYVITDTINLADWEVVATSHEGGMLTPLPGAPPKDV